jgi:hypothetical protein
MPVDPASVASAALWSIYVGWKELLPWVRRNTDGNGNGAAGEKSAAYWKLELRSGVADSLKASLEPKIEAQIGLLTDVKNSLGEVNKGVAELVTLERARQRARR